MSDSDEVEEGIRNLIAARRVVAACGSSDEYIRHVMDVALTMLDDPDEGATGAVHLMIGAIFVAYGVTPTLGGGN